MLAPWNDSPLRYWMVLAIVGMTFSGCKKFEPNIPEFDYTSIPEAQMEQYTDVSSVIARLDSTTTINERLDSFFFITELIKNYNDEAAFDYAVEANRLSIEKGKPLAQGVSAYYLSLLKGRQQITGENLEGAIVDGEIARKLFQTEKALAWEIECTRHLGNLHYKKYEDSTAISYLKRADSLSVKGELEDEEKNKIRGEVLHDLANVLTIDSATYKEGMETYRESLALYEKTGNSSAKARLHADVGYIFMINGEWEKADSLFSLSLAFAKNLNDNHLLSYVYEFLGKNDYSRFKGTREPGYFFSSKANFLKCLDLATDNQYLILDGIGRLFYRKFQYYKEDLFLLDSAIMYFAKALEQAPEEGAFNVMPGLVLAVSTLCDYRTEETTRDCSELLGMSQTAFLNDAYKSVNEMAVSDLEKANTKSRNFERKVLKAENRRRIQNQLIVALIGLFISALIFLIILLWVQQRRLKAKMQALRAQINPHFISNSLNAIESLVNLDQKQAASKYLIHFSRLTRRILNASREVMSTLQAELQILEHFLALEQLRFRDKLSYEIRISDDLQKDLLMVPSMILQPYVENAIWHGIKPKSGPGFLLVDVKKERNTLKVIIEDDGVGREKAAELKAQSVLQQKSVSMEINHERMQAAGRVKGAKIEIEDLFDGKGEAAGTRVMLRFPLKYKK
jgi:two-component sensor histidine kinase